MNCLKERNKYSLKMIRFLCIRSVSSTSASAVLVWELHWRSALYRPSFQAKVRSKIHFWLTLKQKNRKSDRQINVSKEALTILSQNYSCKNLKNWEILFQVVILIKIGKRITLYLWRIDTSPMNNSSRANPSPAQILLPIEKGMHCSTAVWNFENFSKKMATATW